MTEQNNHRPSRVVILGAGPAGLTAGYELSKNDVPCVIIEREELVGGLAKTIEYKDYRFDIGGHRFYTKIPRVEEMWQEILGDDFLRRSRLSRIFYRKSFFDYPLRIWNVITGLGPRYCLYAGLSYLKARLFPRAPEASFEDWIINRFGKALYQAFFKTYTEKVWGISCREIRADWAAQRIRGLSFWVAFKNALLGSLSKSKIKTLISEFHYPRFGPGQLWQAVETKIRTQGNEIHLGCDVTCVKWRDKSLIAVWATSAAGELRRFEGSHFLSTMPMRDFVLAMDPPASAHVSSSARRLGYRDFILVSLILDHQDLFKDNWIYIHDETVRVARIQNFKNWSPDMVPDQSTTCLGMEYFCTEGDALWQMNDADLIEQAGRELELLGLVISANVIDGKVVRVRQAYPVYDREYQQHVATVRNFLSGIENLQLIGRNGMHKYNNQDHAMLSAMLSVENLMGAKHDIWKVNTAEEYLEEASVKRDK